MSLCVVIPVWNDPEGLGRLLSQLLDMPVFDQIIISDDASDPPAAPDALGLTEDVAAALARDRRLLWLRSPAQRGAGHARNMALDRISTSRVIFFDSDDVFLPEFSTLVAELDQREDRQDYDFCIFRHVDSRNRAKGGFGPLGSDDGVWAGAGAMTAKPTALPLKGATQLCRISAYPWNKIYRTAFLREAGIRCTEIPVHNDLELHWMSFLKARRILTSRRVCCEHFVEVDGKRLTNRSGRERFQVFQALQALHAELERNPRRVDFLVPFAEFYTRLFGWIIDKLEPELRDGFAEKARAFLLSKVTLPQYTLIALRSPGVAARINRLVLAAGK